MSAPLYDDDAYGLYEVQQARTLLGKRINQEIDRGDEAEDEAYQADQQEADNA